jgi:hypothetical protein
MVSRGNLWTGHASWHTPPGPWIRSCFWAAGHLAKWRPSPGQTPSLHGVGDSSFANSRDREHVESRYTARAGAQTQDHVGRIHSDPPRVIGEDRHLHRRVLMRGFVTHYLLLFMRLESLRIDISRINCPHRSSILPGARNVRIMGRRTRQPCCLLHDRDTIYFTSFRSITEACHLKTRAPPARSLSVGADAESSVGSPKNECLSKVMLFGDRSSHRMTKSHSERNHQGKSIILLLRQIAEARCE